MLRNFQEKKWFLLNYAIDIEFQGRGLGEEALRELISLMKREYALTEMTTTYTFGNEIAKKLLLRLDL